MRLTHVAASAFTAAIVLGTALPAPAATHTVLYTFQGGAADGANPMADLIEDGGTLYGTTHGGGSSTICNPGCGTVFTFDLNTNSERVLAVFHNGPRGGSPLGALLKHHNRLFGTNSTGGFSPPARGGDGAVFTVDLSTGNTHKVVDFAGTKSVQPMGGVIKMGGTLYGTTIGGGLNANCAQTICGTVFAVDPITHKERLVYAFQDGSGNAGAGPVAGLLDVGGLLFGTTIYGGSTNCGGGCGIVFAVNPATGAETVVHNFEPAEGYNPQSKLINVGGTLYGTTSGSGSGTNCHCGTVFALNPTTGAVTVIYSLPALAVGDLVERGGKLYGTTYFGGSANCTGGCGTIYAVDPKTGTLKIVYMFQGGNDGGYPAAGMINVGGTLYGTTEFAGNTTNAACKIIGPNGCGTLFSFTP